MDKISHVSTRTEQNWYVEKHVLVAVNFLCALGQYNYHKPYTANQSMEYKRVTIKVEICHVYPHKRNA